MNISCSKEAVAQDAHLMRIQFLSLFPVQIAIFSLSIVFLAFSGCNSDQEQPDGAPELAANQANENDPTRLLIAAKQKYRSGRLKAAQDSLRGYLVSEPNDTSALELAGDLAAALGEPSEAIEAYEAALDLSEVRGERVLNKYAITLMQASRAFDCLAILKERAERFPQQSNAAAEMIGLAASLGVAEQGVAMLRQLSMRGGADAESLQVLADPRRVEPDSEWCLELLAKAPKDLRPEYAAARMDADQLAWGAVRTRLLKVVQTHPDFLPAQMLYGLALARTGSFDELPKWNDGLPDSSLQSADYWMVAGYWAEHENRYGEAARAFFEAIRLDLVGYPDALSHLMFALTNLGRSDDAERVAEQINRTTRLRDNLKEFLERDGKSQALAFRIAQSMTALGRLWEAEGWARLALTLPNDIDQTARDQYLEIRKLLTPQTPWQIEDQLLVKRVDCSDLPEVRWVGTSKQRRPTTSYRPAQLRLSNQADERGLQHRCELRISADDPGHWIYQTLGGGAGVIDFDLDGWPDITLAVLNGSPHQEDSSPNRLMRNLDGYYSEVTEAANYLDLGFGQGITVGDYNSDGLPDILDSNIGCNRLFRNNGDGTFSEVSKDAGLDTELWSTCGMIADINGDGFADLYEVTYCGGEEPYEVECRNASGLATCPPLKFDAEVDQFWQGTAEGRFINATNRWAGKTAHGRGLGVVAGLFDEKPGVDLFVANDMTVNQFWSGRQTAQDFHTVDIGAICGVGLSGRSLSQASMGIAAGDPDRDGDIDFFLTHFAGDHNTFYEQAAPGLWIDRTLQQGLAEPSYDLLGFGTQWIDLDNNGSLELMVANGHVDRVDNEKVAYRMPAQIFEIQTDSSVWSEVDTKAVGDYFVDHHLGRSLISVDANRDGLMDVVITHLYEPVALLINETEVPNESLVLNLKATSGQRDAIGAVATLSIGGDESVMQVTAGDGYMCSQGRGLFLGTANRGMAGKADLVELVVQWPLGKVESFGNLEMTGEYLLVEGSGEAFRQ